MRNSFYLPHTNPLPKPLPVSLQNCFKIFWTKGYSGTLNLIVSSLLSNMDFEKGASLITLNSIFELNETSSHSKSCRFSIVFDLPEAFSGVRRHYVCRNNREMELRGFLPNILQGLLNDRISIVCIQNTYSFLADNYIISFRSSDPTRTFRLFQVALNNIFAWASKQRFGFSPSKT